jgi:hypothetical protein
VYAVKPAGGGALADRCRRQAQPEQLLETDHGVLPCRKGRDRRVQRGRVAKALHITYSATRPGFAPRACDNSATVPLVSCQKDGM